MGSPTDQHIVEIIRAGISAPSADNRHPLRFERTELGLRLWDDGALNASPERHRRALMLMSIGAVVENMVLCAGRLGYGIRVQYLPGGNDRIIAEITWTSANAQPQEIAGAIALRHTNRRFYRGPPLDRQRLDELGSAVDSAAGLRLSWLEGDFRRKALPLVLVAESERFRTQSLHEELFTAIRFDVGWHRSCEEGLPPGALEVERFLRPGFSLLRHWKVMQATSWIGIHRVLALRSAYLPCRLTPHLGVITASDDAESSMVAAGRAFERVWLRAASWGLALQPMLAATALALAPRNSAMVPSKLSSSLATGWQRIFPGRTPLILFRLGRAAPPTVTASRKAVEDYMAEHAAPR